MAKLLLVDLENVGILGLKGITGLTEMDKVVIFHGVVTPNISIEDAYMIFNCPAKIELVSHKKSGKNALDFKITAYLGYEVARGQYEDYYIVSKDKGYLSALELLSGIERKVMLKCITCIEDLWEKPKEETEDVEEEAQMITVLLEQSKTRQEFHNKLVKAFKDTKKASEIYKREKIKLVQKVASN